MRRTLNSVDLSNHLNQTIVFVVLFLGSLLVIFGVLPMISEGKANLTGIIMCAAGCVMVVVAGKVVFLYLRSRNLSAD